MMRGALPVLLLAGACGQVEYGEAPAVSAAVPASRVAPVTRTNVASASAASQTPPSPPCAPGMSHHWIRVEGDGEPLTLRQGAPWPARYCGPALFTMGGAYGEPTVAACKRRDERRFPCFWANARQGAYLDRKGVAWKLDVRNFRITEKDRTAKGDITANGTAGRRNGLTLTGQFEVGTEVGTEAAQGWYTNGDSGESFGWSDVR